MMSWIQCERGFQANLCFLGRPRRKHFPHIPTHTRVCGLEGSRATARPGGKRKAWQRNGIHFTPSLPNPWSCSSQQLQDVGGGWWWDHAPSPSSPGVGWVKDVSQDSLTPSMAPTAPAEPAHPAQENPNPHRLLNAGNPPAPLSASSPGSNSLFKLEPVHPGSLEAGQHLDLPREPTGHLSIPTLPAPNVTTCFPPSFPSSPLFFKAARLLIKKAEINCPHLPIRSSSACRD